MMLEKILKFSIFNRWLVLVGTLALGIYGAFCLTKLPIDAVPDITNVQVQINTPVPGYSPFEVEQRITFPIETGMSGLPDLVETRSLSRYGLSQVTLIFEDGTDIYFARQLANERLSSVREELPDDVHPMLGPIASGLGEIYTWTLRLEEDSKHSLQDLREIQDWVIKPQLRTIKGVTEVNTIGAFQKEFHITPFPSRLLAYGIGMEELVLALEKNNANVGAGFIEKNSEQILIRIPGQVEAISSIENIIVKNSEGVPIFVRDVADVILGEEQRSGAGTQDGAEALVGTVFMLMGENSRTVAKAVHEKLGEIQKSIPEGIKLTTVYDRTSLVDATIHTVSKNLIEGALLVILILFVFLRHLGSSLVAACVIPLAMGVTVIGMVKGGMSGNLMSLGALDFGLIVDGAVIIVENAMARMAEARHQLGRTLKEGERLETIFNAAKEVRQATMFGEFIIMIVYLPILTLTGVEGKMFYPMAFTVIVALLGAMILSMTFVPAAITVVLRGDAEEKENEILEWLSHQYMLVQDVFFRFQKRVLIGIACLFALSIAIFTQMGSEFVPRLDEGDIAMHAMRIPGTSLRESVKMQTSLEAVLKSFPEVRTIFSKIGTAEIATDPMPPNVADTFIMLEPRDKWPSPREEKASLIARLESALARFLGQQYEFTQPIEMRFNELISGVRSDVGIKIFGDDMDTLLSLAQKTASLAQRLKGAADVKVEQVSGLPLMTIDINRQKLARVGMNTSDLQSTIAIALGGKLAGTLFEGDRRFPIIVKLPEGLRQDVEELKRLPLSIPFHEKRENETSGYQNHIALGSVANLDIKEGPNQISRENGKRRVVVTLNVRERDLGSFVSELRERLDTELKLPTGYWIGLGGQFQQMISATNRLKLVIPIVLLLIFGLLYLSFSNFKDALLVFSGVPFALTGGIIAIYLRGIPLSISAGIGFIALSGVAVLNGLVMIGFIKKLREEGLSILDAARKGAHGRLRPVLMTALVASFGFVPMAIGSGTGAEVQKPLATVVIGGIFSSTVLTLLVLPLLYTMFHGSKKPMVS